MKRNTSELRSEKEQREGHSILVLQEQNKVLELFCMGRVAFGAFCAEE